jgi:hypothetical protein
MMPARTVAETSRTTMLMKWSNDGIPAASSFWKTFMMSKCLVIRCHLVTTWMFVIGDGDGASPTRVAPRDRRRTARGQLDLAVLRANH